MRYRMLIYSRETERLNRSTEDDARIRAAHRAVIEDGGEAVSPASFSAKNVHVMLASR
jgi:hypothetical protein